MADVPGDSTTTTVLDLIPTAAAATGTFSGDFETPGDRDWLKIIPQFSGTHSFFLSVQEMGGVTGASHLKILDGDGVLLPGGEAGSGTGVGGNALLSVPLTAGTIYYVEISDERSLRDGAAPHRWRRYLPFARVLGSAYRRGRRRRHGRSPLGWRDRCAGRAGRRPLDRW